MNRYIKHMIVLCLLVIPVCSQSPIQELAEDIQAALVEFKSNLFNNETFSHVIASFTDEVKHDFNEMVEDVWCLFGKIQKYCMKQFSDNSLFEKYKKFTRKNFLSGSIIFSLEDKNLLLGQTTRNVLLNDALELECQPFYETLSASEQEEYRNMMRNLCAFFSDIAVECENIMQRYESVAKALEIGLQESQQVLRIEYGLEYPFPSLVYVLG